MAKTKKTEDATAIATIASTALKNLVSLRGDFDKAEGAFQTGRQHLYAVLGKVFAEYVAVKDAGPKNRCVESFRSLLDELDDDRAEYAKEGIKTKASSLERVMLRVVCGQAFTEEREKAYGAVLRKAYEAKVQSSGVSLPAWLHASGGVEVLRLDSKPSGKTSKTTNAIKAATIRYKATFTEAKIPDGIHDQQSADEKYQDGNFYVALVRRDTNTIVATTNQKSAVSKALEVLGAKMDLAAERKAAKDARAAYKAHAQSIVAKVVSQSQIKKAA